MNKNYRDLDKLRSSRAKAVRNKMAKYGNPRRSQAMAAVMIDHYQTQDRYAAEQFAREQELRRISMKMFGTDSKFEDLTPEQVQEVVDELGATTFTTSTPTPTPTASAN